MYIFKERLYCYISFNTIGIILLVLIIIDINNENQSYNIYQEIILLVIYFSSFFLLGFTVLYIIYMISLLYPLCRIGYLISVDILNFIKQGDEFNLSLIYKRYYLLYILLGIITLFICVRLAYPLQANKINPANSMAKLEIKDDKV